MGALVSLSLERRLEKNKQLEVLKLLSCKNPEGSEDDIPYYNLKGSFQRVTPQQIYSIQHTGSGDDLLRIRLSIQDMLLDKQHSLAKAQRLLYRDDPEVVKHFYTIAEARHDPWSASVYEYGSSNHKTSYKAKTRDTRKTFAKTANRTCLSKGVTVAEMASDQSLWLSDGASDPIPSEATIRRLLIHNGWLKLAPYGREQSRSLATEKTIVGGYGQNIDPSGKHSIRLSGGARSFPFPVFWKERLPELVASLGWSQIISNLSKIEKKRERLSWLLHNHSYLPTPALSELSDMGVATVKRAKAAMT